MQSMAKYRTAFNLLFLAILATAYTGKAFHYHSDEYYTDFERTACTSNGQSSIADDCSICHFSFYSCLYAATPIFAFPVLLLVQHMAGSGVERNTAVMTPQFFNLGAKIAYDRRIYKSMTLQFSAGIHNMFNACQRDFDRGQTAIRAMSTDRRCRAVGTSGRNSTFKRENVFLPRHAQVSLPNLTADDKMPPAELEAGGLSCRENLKTLNRLGT